MKKTIVLLCTGCPFKGEAFLRNELNYLPEDCRILLFPIMHGPEGREIPDISHQVQVMTQALQPSALDKLYAALHSPWALVRHGEWRAAMERRNPLHNLLKAMKFAYLGASRARGLARCLKKRFGNEEFIFYSYWLYETAYAGAWLRERFPGSRLITRCHGFDLYEHRHLSGYLPYRNYLMGQADRICPISENGVSYLNEKHRAKWQDKIHLSRLGTGDFGLGPQPQGDVPLLVSCSNLVDVKRVDRIIEALSHLNRPVRWVHFGDGPLRERLEVQAANLPDYVAWEFRGMVPNEQIMEFYRSNAVDVFLNVSESEGVPVSIMEALSFGIPVIATNVGGTGELVEDGENGVLLEPDFKTDALVRSVCNILEADEHDRTELRRHAREVWQEKCSARVNYDHFYCEILNMEGN